MGISISNVCALDRENKPILSCDFHKWESEFGREYAIIYRVLCTKPGICTTYFSQSKHRVIYTFYDAMCEDNLVAVNIEFMAVRDVLGPYKLDAIKVKEFGENFSVRRRRSIGTELLFLSYVMGGRTNQLTLHERGDGYEIVFRSESPSDSVDNSVNIGCYAAAGLFVSIPPNQRSLYYPNGEPPPQYVMKDVNDIRRLFMEDAGSQVSHGNDTTRPSLSYSQHDLILNTGQNQGLLNGSNFRHCQFHIEGSRIQFKGSLNQ